MCKMLFKAKMGLGHLTIAIPYLRISSYMYSIDPYRTLQSMWYPCTTHDICYRDNDTPVGKWEYDRKILTGLDTLESENPREMVRET